MVQGASFENGLLRIELVREIPEAMKPRRIAINGGSASTLSALPKQRDLYLSSRASIVGAQDPHTSKQGDYHAADDREFWQCFSLSKRFSILGPCSSGRKML